MNKLTHTPTTNDVYEDTRNGSLKRIYIDKEGVFTRSEDTKRRGEGHIHNLLDEETLLNRIDQGRLEHKPDATPDIPKFDPIYSDSNNTSNQATNETTDSSTTTTDGQNKKETTNTDTNSPESNLEPENKTESHQSSPDTESNSNLDESEQPIQTIPQSPPDEETTPENTNTPSESNPNDTPQETRNEKIEWAIEVDLIGSKIQERLYEHEYKTPKDIEEADKDNIISIKGIGEEAADNLKQFAKEG